MLKKVNAKREIVFYGCKFVNKPRMNVEYLNYKMIIKLAILS